MGTSGFDAEYSVSVVREFPAVSGADVAHLRGIADEFLAEPQWVEVADEVRSPGVVSVSVLTLHGVRIGKRGNVQFEGEVVLAGPLEFVRCGRAETWDWPPETDRTFGVTGLHIHILDSTPIPYQILPLDQEGNPPSMDDVRHFTGSSAPCLSGSGG